MKNKIATKKRLFAPCSHCVNECTDQPIQVLIVKPYFRPYGATICPKLHSMQDIVGGCIEHDLAIELADRIEALLRCDKKSAAPEPENENV